MPNPIALAPYGARILARKTFILVYCIWLDRLTDQLFHWLVPSSESECPELLPVSGEVADHQRRWTVLARRGDEGR